MNRHTVLSIILPWLAFLLPIPVGALSPISMKGTKLFDNDGNQFFVKGVAYSSGNDRMDPLLDTDQCQIDAGLMKSLGANTIRVYTVAGSENHDGCMQAFASQGIYVWLDLPNPLAALNRNDVEWTMELYTNWTGTVDAFAGYDNLLFFNIGNEVIDDNAETTHTAPFIKAAARDIKAFRIARGYRPIPISYSAGDIAEYRVLTADYLTCGEADDAIDIYGMNIYSWCGNSSYYKSGYDKLYEEFQKINIPVLFSETGCKPNEGTGNRDFAEVSTMLGPVFQALFSGVVVYEWTMELSGYGIVEYSNDRNTGFPSTLNDYNALATVFSTANPIGTSMAAYKPSNSAPACPTSNPSAGWLVDANAALPTISGLQQDTITARTTITTKGTATGPSGTGTGPSSQTSDPRGDGLGGDNQQVGNTSSRLSAGTIAGIAVGCAAFIFGALVTFIYIWKRKAKKQKLKKIVSAGDEGSDSSQGFKAELPAHGVKAVILRQEMDALQHPQAQEYYGPGCVDGTGVPHEANKPGWGQSQLYEIEGSVPAVSELPGSIIRS